MLRRDPIRCAVFLISSLLLLTGCGGGTAPLYNNTTFRSAMGNQDIPAGPQQFTQFFQDGGNGNGGDAGARDRTAAAPPPPLSRRQATPAQVTVSVLTLLTTLNDVGGAGNMLGLRGQELFAAGIRTSRRTDDPTSMPGGMLGSLLTRLAHDLTDTDHDTAELLVAAGHEDLPRFTFLTLQCDGDASDGRNPFGGSYQIQSFSTAPDSGFFLSGNVMTVNFFDCILGDTTHHGGLNIADFQYRNVADQGSYDQLMSGRVSFNGLSLTRDERRVSLATDSDSSLTFTSRLREGRLISTRLDSGTLTISLGDERDDRLRDSRLEIEFEEDNAAYRLAAAGTVISDLTGSELTMTTPRPLRWQAGATHPFDGSLQIDAPAIGRITASPLDGLLVRITVDFNGNGIAETDETMPWATLLD